MQPQPDQKERKERKEKVVSRSLALISESCRLQVESAAVACFAGCSHLPLLILCSCPCEQLQPSREQQQEEEAAEEEERCLQELVSSKCYTVRY